MSQKPEPFIDVALSRLTDQVRKNEGLIDALKRKIVYQDAKPESQCGEALTARPRPETVAAVLNDLIDDLCRQNEQMEILIKQLSEQVGEVKII